MVRLIRSKGVGVFFVTQNPLDVPESVLSQLGNRIQHALRAYTPREQKAVKTAAETFRPNPEFDAFETITQLGVGEALVSTLEAKGVPGIVQRTLMRPPSSRLGPIEDARARGGYEGRARSRAFTTRRSIANSAAEMLAERPRRPSRRRKNSGEKEEEEGAKRPQPLDASGFRRRRRRARRATRTRRPSTRRRSNRQSVREAAMKSLARSVSSQLGRALVRGILGSLKKGL